MGFVQIETTGESRLAYVNPQYVSYLSEGIYGTSIHFAAGDYIVTTKAMPDVAALLDLGMPDAATATEALLIARPAD